MADASPLIALGQLGRLDLLGVYRRLTVPEQVWKEVLAGETVDHKTTTAVRRFAKSRPVQARRVRVPGGFLPSFGEGERAAILLAERDPGSVLLVDDEDAGVAARHLRIKTMGTLMVLVRAVDRGALGREDCIIAVNALVRNRFYVSPDLLNEMLDEVRRA